MPFHLLRHLTRPQARVAMVVAFFFSVVVIPATAGEGSAPAERLAHLELICLGQNPTGSLSQRLDDLERLILGETQPGTIPERVATLDNVLFTTTSPRPSLLFQLNALEWALYHRVFTGPLLTRLEHLETALQGKTTEGPLGARLALLRPLFLPAGSLPVTRIDLTAGTLVPIELLADLSSQTNKPGESFPFAVAETVFQDGLVALPRGSAGEGRIVKIQPPGRMGRDAEITVVFGPLTALDGTPVPVTTGEECIAANKSQSLTLRVTAAGMIALGPAGILSGLFVRGKEVFLGRGTRLYVQTSVVTPCFTLAGGTR
ncbi:MAG: hypothetical protein GX493_06685 [Firmicutes bacterium]|nr:hypothetical protein [Bacillota bacterium]